MERSGIFPAFTKKFRFYITKINISRFGEEGLQGGGGHGGFGGADPNDIFRMFFGGGGGPGFGGGRRGFNMDDLGDDDDFG